MTEKRKKVTKRNSRTVPKPQIKSKNKKLVVAAAALVDLAVQEVVLVAVEVAALEGTRVAAMPLPAEPTLGVATRVGRCQAKRHGAARRHRSSSTLSRLKPPCERDGRRWSW